MIGEIYVDIVNYMTTLPKWFGWWSIIGFFVTNFISVPKKRINAICLLLALGPFVWILTFVNIVADIFVKKMSSMSKKTEGG